MTVAAFFDVDRTLLAGASGFHLARPMRRRGLLTTRQLVRSALLAAMFSAQGTTHQQLDKFTIAFKELIAGWERDTLVSIVEDELERRIRPMVFQEALARIASHKAQGHQVYAVSATMSEIVAPLAELLDMDGAIATELEVGPDGRYTGDVARPNHGDEKAVRLREFAAERGIDLAASSAYSDSITDAAFLRAVGRAYAVNPDKQLRQLAEAEGWGILRFGTRVKAPLHKHRAARVGAIALVGGLALRAHRRRRRARRA